MSGRDDLDWLYGRESTPDPKPDHTQVMSQAEQAELDRRARAAGHRPASGPASGQGTAQRPPQQRDVRPVPAPPPEGRSGRGGSGGGGSGAGPGGGPPGTTGRRRPRRRRTGRKVVAVLALLLAACLVYLVAVPLVAWNTVDKVANQPKGDRPADTPGQTYLLVGSDSREGLSAEEKKKLGTGSAEGQRTDTMMLLYVPPGGRPAMISIPRDSYVEVPGNGKNKINAAYAIGGPKLLTATVEQATGLRVDHYVEIGFGGFVDVIDAMDGIEMCVPKDIKDKNSHLNLKKGCQTFDGVTALGYVRMRYADPEGDLGRVKRQRQMVSAVAKKAATPMTVINPVRYWNLNKAVAGAVRLGESTSTADMPRLALAASRLSGDDALALTIPVGGNISSPAGAALSWDKERCEELFAAIKRGDTSGLDKFKK
ncbi:MAG: LCP family protein [Propionibacteriales bacterium]|nr:LCP family protein [Propionibacteriales bacterium]